MNTTKLFFPLSAFLLAITIIGCQGGCYHPGHGWVTAIKTIKENPEDYRDKSSATIKGVVTDNVTLVGYSGYTLQDKNGDDIKVMGKGSRTVGEEIYVTGHYETLMGIGKHSLDAFMMDE